MSKMTLNIRTGDWVVSHDRNGLLIPNEVGRTYQNMVKHVLNYFGTTVTLDHVYLCGEGVWKDQFRSLLDILLADEALVGADGRSFRATTKALVGSAD